MLAPTLVTSSLDLSPDPCDMRIFGRGFFPLLPDLSPRERDLAVFSPQARCHK